MPESRPGCLVVLLIEVVVESDLDRWADDNFILYITDFEMIERYLCRDSQPPFANVVSYL